MVAPAESGGDAADVQVASAAWKHVKSVAVRDDARSVDLFDQLCHSGRDTQYAVHPSEVRVQEGYG
ncbi:hypothetical protein H632_c501p0, partial [Helicosporidium sp. ATCC 50920]